jgi:hypothetical protein
VNPKISIMQGITALTAAVPTVAMHSTVEFKGLISGFSILAFLALYKLLDRKILETSSGRRTKAFQDLVETASVFLIIGATALAQIVPVWLGVLTIALLGAVKTFKLQMARRYRKSYRLGIGQDYWIGFTAAIFLGSYLNSYFLFYGLIVLSLILVYDLGSLTREIKR